MEPPRHLNNLLSIALTLYKICKTTNLLTIAVVLGLQSILAMDVGKIEEEHVVWFLTMEGLETKKYLCVMGRSSLRSKRASKLENRKKSGLWIFESWMIQLKENSIAILSSFFVLWFDKTQKYKGSGCCCESRSQGILCILSSLTISFPVLPWIVRSFLKSVFGIPFLLWQWNLL